MTKEQDFKIRFAETLQDLNHNGIKDKEAMWLLGSLGADIADGFNQSTWSGMKTAISKADYDMLLQNFISQGNEHHKAGNTKAAYAIQALATSLIVGTQRTDPDMVTGEQLIDMFIDHMVATYRKAKIDTAN